MNYFCTCNKGRKKETQDHTAYYPTKVDGEGICSYCGYFAVLNPDSKNKVNVSQVSVTKKLNGIEAFRNGVSLGVFRTIKNCAEVLKIKISWDIRDCAKGKIKSYLGYTFKEVSCE